MTFSAPVFKKVIRDPRRTASIEDGFTLVEVLIGTVLFVIVMVGLLSAVMMAFRMTLETRYRDRALNALASVADQFQNSPITDKTTAAAKVLYSDTGGIDTGAGLAWDPDKQVFVYLDGAPPASIVTGNASGLPMSLGTVGSNDVTISAVLVRNVKSLTDPVLGADPKWLEGTFKITYTFPANKVNVLQLKALRYLNRTDS